MEEVSEVGILFVFQEVLGDAVVGEGVDTLIFEVWRQVEVGLAAFEDGDMVLDFEHGGVESIAAVVDDSDVGGDVGEFV